MGRSGVAFAAATAATVSVVALIGSVFWAYQDTRAVPVEAPVASAPPVVTQAPPVASRRSDRGNRSAGRVGQACADGH